MDNARKKIPVLFENKANCCGCGACYAKCPVNAISMTQDEEGFMYPQIDEVKCVSCNQCVSVCAFKIEDRQHIFEGKVYAAKHKNNEIRKLSRSGGVFTALSDRILEQGGCVYGCIMKNSFEAVHIKATTVNERDRMRESKYIQSNMLDIYLEVYSDLESQKKILFSGTSCQIAGLKEFLGKEYSNLYCVDIVCHGVPSPLVWRKYLEWQEQRNGSKCKKVDFRNKNDFGWAAHVETLTLENGKKVHSQVFKNLFYKHLILRPSCHICPYKNVIHPADITIADYWGIEQAVPGFSDNKGVSLVLVNNAKGEEIFGAIKNNLYCVETDIERCMQTPLKEPFAMPENRTMFWCDLKEQSFEKIAKKYGNKGLKSELKIFLLWIKQKINFNNKFT